MLKIAESPAFRRGEFVKDYNYDDGDMLTILNKKGKIGDFKKAEFSKDTLSLSIVGSGKISFKNVAESTAFNINGKTYHVRGNTIR